MAMTRQQATEISVAAYNKYFSPSYGYNLNDNSLLKQLINVFIDDVGYTPEQTLKELTKNILYFAAIDNPSKFPGYSVTIGQTNPDTFVESLPSSMVVDFLYPDATLSTRSQMITALDRNDISNSDFSFAYIKADAQVDKPTLSDVVRAATDEGSSPALVDSIQQLYLAYFGRPAEQAGLKYWNDKVLSQTNDLDSVAVEFSKSYEFADKYGSTGHSGLVTAVYRNVLGREPDSQKSIDYWVGRLVRSEDTPASLVKSFLGTNDLNDRANINNRIEVSKAYTELSGSNYNSEQGYSLIHSVTPARSSVDNAISKIGILFPIAEKPLASELVSEALPFDATIDEGIALVGIASTGPGDALGFI